jgi:hypothetical protein
MILTPKIRIPSIYGIIKADNRDKNPNRYWRLKKDSYITQIKAKSKYAPAAIVYRITDKTRKTIKRLIYEVRSFVAFKYK